MLSTSYCWFRSVGISPPFLATRRKTAELCVYARPSITSMGTLVVVFLPSSSHLAFTSLGAGKGAQASSHSIPPSHRA